MNVRTLVIGGGSRVARALRQLYPGSYHFVHRSGNLAHTNFHSGDQIVDSYEQISAEDMKGYTTVINLVGTTVGTPKDLMRVNADLPLHFATEAGRAKVDHFIALSSFSVFGPATRIHSETPLAPQTAYGRSRLAGETRLAQLSPQIACTIARCPLLYGADGSKLEQLVKFWCRIRVLPVPARPVNRSMVHYNLAARYIDDVAHRLPKRKGLTFDHFADPVTFEYRKMASILRSVAGTSIQTLHLPTPCFKLLAFFAPEISRSMYSDSVLDPELNHFRDLSHSRLEMDIMNIVQENWNNL